MPGPRPDRRTGRAVTFLQGQDPGSGPAGRALWCSAGVAALGLHLGVALWLLEEPAVVPAPYEPPPAIMIDLAPEPEAVLTEETEISPDERSDEASDAADDAKAPEETNEPDETPKEPLPEEAEIAGEPTDIPSAPLAKAPDLTVNGRPVPVPVPAARPKPPVRKPVEIVRKPAPPRQRAQEKPSPKAQASKATVKAQARVVKSDRTAAVQSSSSLFSSSASPARWEGRLKAYLERRKKYPRGARARGEVGTVYVRLRIDSEGNVLVAWLAGSSGFSSLDEEVLSLVHRSSPVPAPPPEANRLLTVPVNFR